ncbi:AAA family ATPase [archaeon]|nr:AAA family ATPase [archaeon]
MIIKKIILDNIRSYEHEEIIFEKGSTLLAGDIGSGKTSILLGIEFGLFGLQPGQRGSVLLRNGEEVGGIKLFFEVEDKDVIVERTLKKGKTISQDYAAITVNGIKEELSVTELKSKVLEILNYPGEFSKKQNILYKFTVYTPQEEMKQIILEDSESRLNTLRHVFGVDKYKRILENVSILRLKLREERRLMEGATQTLDEDKKICENKEKDLENKKEGIFALESDLLLKIEKRKDKEKEKNEIAKLIEGKGELRAKLGQTQGLFHSKTEIFTNNSKSIDSLKKEINDFSLFNFNSSELQELEEEILKKKNQKEKLSSLNLEISSNLAALKSKLFDFEDLEKKMQNLEVCPTCHQNVDAIYRANVLNKNHNERSQAKNKIEEMEIEKTNIQNKIREFEISINLHEKKLTDLKILKMRLEGIKEKENKVLELEKQNYSIEGDLHLLKNQIETIKGELLSLSKYDNIYDEKEKELGFLLREERMADIKLAESKKEIEVFENTILELKERIKKIEEIKEKLEYVINLEGWLNKQFMPLISTVEKNVMISLKSEFSRLFSEWFQILVPENFNVRLSDDFSPLIEQKDYEIDYAYLSGGERTAIALAYRLALNQVINSLMSKIKTKDLVILDEPTDGFSSQQLDKMREVLDELNVAQLIIVSHEQKIEGFVENVIKFRKEYGISIRDE